MGSLDCVSLYSLGLRVIVQPIDLNQVGFLKNLGINARMNESNNDTHRMGKENYHGCNDTVAEDTRGQEGRSRAEGMGHEFIQGGRYTLA